MPQKSSGGDPVQVRYKLRPGIVLALQLIIALGIIVLFATAVFRIRGGEGSISEESATDQRVSIAGEQLDENSNPIPDTVEEPQGDFSEDPEIPDAATEDAAAKSSRTQLLIEETGIWIATDYAEGDINPGNYTVQSGDTLWEIAEAVYGSGSMWTMIRDANAGQIGFLANGSQALIVPGQVLSVPLQL
ncbi:MAG: LysM domain/BON superfamily protein [candidate division WS6 bacterium OLB20]|uniref:LysM domain/BON superfamily protein n=1 Tax=candidate division WS6 bacterium OLB20 TaxID=1617426 RepID=A0A136LXQ6_9BACT|nr:MAG: LysM domain/BON superfamily protein [candidate division WS6 bacterium OLB20]